MKTFAGLISVLAVISGVVYGAETNATHLLIFDIEEEVSAFRNGTNITTTTTSTTYAPTTPALPSVGHWSVNYTDSGHYCILFDASSIELDITYPTLNGSSKTVNIKVPLNAEQPIGSEFNLCGKNLTSNELNETLTLSVPLAPSGAVSFNHLLLSFFFTRDANITGDHTLDKAQLYRLKVSYTYTDKAFPGILPSLIGKGAIATTNGTLHEFSVLKDRSYQCNTASSIKIDNNTTLKFSGVRAQAFLASDHFSSAEPCPADAHTSDLVPIIIGAVLAVIVLIVLVAYLIGRARMRRTTYESI